MGDEDDELGEGAPHLGARALEQVLGEAVGVRKQDVVCKPIADILTVSEQDAEGVVPGRGEGGGRNERFFFFKRRIKNSAVIVANRGGRGLPVTGRTPHYFLGVETCAEEKPSSQLSTYHSNLLRLWQEVVLA